MARPRSFREEEVLRSAADAFTVGGYEGTSVDDLVKALDLHRGSIYKAFGSKRGLFLAVLGQYVESGLASSVQELRQHSGPANMFEMLTHSSSLDLLLIAALERGQRDVEVALLVRRALAQLEELLSEGEPVRVESDGEVLASRSPPAQAIRLMGERLYQRLRPEVDHPHTDASRKVSDGADQH